jgi:cytoskeleton protein RodZ
MSLRQIADATKISLGVLEALERNDISRLPGGIFGRAFVRSYAVEVGLDPERTIHDFLAQFPHESITAGHPASRQVETSVAISNTHPPLSAVVAVLTVSILLAGAAVRFDAWRILTSYSAPFWTIQNWRLPAWRPEAPRSAPSVSSDPFTTANPGQTGEPGAPPPDPPPAVDPVPQPTATDAPGDRLTVRLSVLRPCWVSATVDGRKAIERLLQIGEEQTINVRREIILTAADAGALALTLNGDRAKPLGNLGEVVTARLNLTNFREFLAR